MNDEIKKILNRFDFVKKEPNKLSYYPEDLLTREDMWILYDYITNLQQAVKNTKETADDMLYELNEENEKIKSRIEKANEFIKNTPLYEITYDYNMEDELEIQNVSDETASNKLLNILNGRSAE